MLLVIDNFDSFTYNLVQYLGELGADPVVHRNNEITVDAVAAGGFTGVVISPGPGTPADAGISIELIRKLGARLPILGVCLGHQAIGEAYGGRIVRAPKPIHGKSSRLTHNGRGVFRGLDSPIEVARYHSLVIERETIPQVLEITAETDDGIIMGVRHKAFMVEGVQFHPESILTSEGRRMLQNFLEVTRKTRAATGQ
jgi:anthranilate synthase/aminodeoxychorismate synthase-like glutamine amidotransferase